MFLGLDYNTWWFLVFGGVISGYAILDGFDLGAGSLHLFCHSYCEILEVFKSLHMVCNSCNHLVEISFTGEANKLLENNKSKKAILLMVISVSLVKVLLFIVMRMDFQIIWTTIKTTKRG